MRAAHQSCADLPANTRNYRQPGIRRDKIVRHPKETDSVATYGIALRTSPATSSHHEDRIGGENQGIQIRFPRTDSFVLVW